MINSETVRNVILVGRPQGRCSLSIAVIPAYKVIAKSARQALGLPFEEAVDKLDTELRG